MASACDDHMLGALAVVGADLEHVFFAAVEGGGVRQEGEAEGVAGGVQPAELKFINWYSSPSAPQLL